MTRLPYGSDILISRHWSHCVSYEDVNESIVCLRYHYICLP